MSSTYHHGDLPATLRATSATLLAERGPAGFSLREVARRAGVSHAAPKNHFGSTRGLLTAVAIEGYEHLSAAFQDVVDADLDASARLNALGRAYVDCALSYPGQYTLMTKHDLLHAEDPALLMVCGRTYELLLETMELVRDELNPALDVPGAAALAWASIHGLLELTPSFLQMADRFPTPVAALEETIARFTELIINGFAAR